MERMKIVNALNPAAVGTEVTLAGWVRTARHSKGGFSFVALNDGSCMANIQLVAGGELANYDADVLHLTTGCSLVVRGTLVESQGKGQAVELQAAELTVLGGADETNPIQQKRHTFEFLRTKAHLRSRTNSFGAVFRVRNVICRAVHDFFQQRGFLYVHTPLITASDCEGAGELFRVSTLDHANLPKTDDGAVDYDKEFFGKETFLTVSGQLEVEPFCCSLGDVYTFGPTFRAENSNTPRHLAEFWMVEPELAFANIDDDADCAEAMLKYVFQTVLDECAEDLAFFNQRIDKTLIETLTHIVATPFERISYTAAMEILQAADKEWEFAPEWGCDLQTEHERYLAEEHFKTPVAVMHYPESIKPFYMYRNEPDEQGRRTVRAMDILVPKVGEIIGGSQREDRLDVLEERMKECGLTPEEYWWYVDLRRYGTIPHAGFGLGLERLVLFCTGMANIRDVIPYPRTPRTAF
ncbi:MAG: asparagine--tRNA ligase [Phycisphaerales bacterium]|nr:asparagine--tRNA ligase [Phycisphaerales bacterium]MBT7171577.1 asparagine--tRNA ligase [Phycisphaerales bacterium]